MKVDTIVSVVIAGMVAGVIGFVLTRKKPRKLKVDQYVTSWKELQAFCKDKSTWPQAITAADKLLDSALKRRKFGGKSMGERLVSAQHTLTNNDGVWFAHNLYKKIAAAESNARLKETDVKNALVAYRQALKDIGALPKGDSKNG